MQVNGTHRLRRGFHAVLDHPWYLVLLVIVVLFIDWAVSSRVQAYHVRAEFNSAFNIVSGQPVDVAGIQVGMVDDIKYNKTIGSKTAGGVILTVGISDPNYVPLHQGTKATLRWGSTIGNGTRRLDLEAGPASAPKIPDMGIIPPKDTIAPVDVDQIQDVFHKPVLKDLTNMLGHIAAGIDGQAPALHAGINSSAPALGAANNIFNDLNGDTYALKGLIASGDSLTHVLSSRASTVSNLVSSAGTTFAALSDNANGLQQSIQNLPGALTEARGTLAILDHSVGIVNRLVVDIRPGAAKLSPLADQLTPTLVDLHSVVPNGVAALQTATRSAPSITRLLNVGTPFISKVRSVTNTFAPMLSCIRQYTPEISGAVWGAGSWISTYVRARPHGTPGVTYTGRADGPYVDQHGVRAMPEASTESFHAYPPGFTSKDFVALSGGTKDGLGGKQYAFIRPPGLGANRQVRYVPQCGITPSVLNPATDPESQSAPGSSAP